ncbi:hypothetical protein BZA77DRAFT_49770 [Pyronema omphalodes]|nr:hypothetical protein BZA77DRAFT_49770 [Pyronema omphalodes]
MDIRLSFQALYKAPKAPQRKKITSIPRTQAKNKSIIPQELAPTYRYHSFLPDIPNHNEIRCKSESPNLQIPKSSNLYDHGLQSTKPQASSLKPQANKIHILPSPVYMYSPNFPIDNFVKVYIFVPTRDMLSCAHTHTSSLQSPISSLQSPASASSIQNQASASASSIKLQTNKQYPTPEAEAEGIIKFSVTVYVSSICKCMLMTGDTKSRSHELVGSFV